ncbi:MAG: thioredoxin domain-containing protein [Nevskiales bacterium]
MNRKLPMLCAVLLFALGGARATAAPELDWQPWTVDVFQRAARENKLVYLYLEAVWCHWCHVMEAETFADEDVIEYLDAHFLPVRVDHDARPDLANRYRDYGWPANILYNAEGRELVRRAGYIAPKEFLTLLTELVAHPNRTPHPQSVKAGAGPDALAEATRRELLQRHIKAHDKLNGGLKGGQKYLDRYHVEYALWLAARGDKTAEKRARQTLDAALALLDPVWGGVYQYSTHSDWRHPHYEKLLRVQAAYLRIYALAYAQLGDEKYLRAARRIRDYIAAFLTSPRGGFHSSQDADLVSGEKADNYYRLNDAGRRAEGIPRVDPHQYAETNGAAIEAHAVLYEATGDPADLAPALKAAAFWNTSRARLKQGGFAHDARQKPPPGGPYLSDQLGMGQGFLLLHRATGQRLWLSAARECAQMIGQKFKREDAGFNPSLPGRDALPPQPYLEDNLQALRFFNLLARYTGEQQHRELAQHALRYLAQAAVALERIEESGILLAADEFDRDPAHLAVVGGKQDAAAQQLFAAALRYPGWYKRIEWWDHAEGPLPNPDVQYPRFPRAAAYVCANRRCSPPAFEVTALQKLLALQAGPERE